MKRSAGTSASAAHSSPPQPRSYRPTLAGRLRCWAPTEAQRLAVAAVGIVVAIGGTAASFGVALRPLGTGRAAGTAVIVFAVVALAVGSLVRWMLRDQPQWSPTAHLKIGIPVTAPREAGQHLRLVHGDRRDSREGQAATAAGQSG